MTNLVKNPGFQSGLTDWTASGTVLARDYDGHFTTDCAELQHTAAASAILSQAVTLPGITGHTNYNYDLGFSVRYTGTTTPAPALAVLVLDASGDTLYRWAADRNRVNTWFNITKRILLKPGTSCTLRFEVAKNSDVTSYWRVDDVGLEAVTVAASSCADITAELRKRRHDIAAVKHPLARYREIVNQAIGTAPRGLWQRQIDTSLTTADEDRDYALTALADLTRPDQVHLLEVEDADGNWVRLVNWTVEDDDGTLTLRLAADPVEAGRSLRLHYIAPWEALDCDDATDTTGLDRDWLVAQAMVMLLMEADPAREPAEQINRDLAFYADLRKSLEARVRRRRPAGDARFHRWD